MAANGGFFLPAWWLTVGHAVTLISGMYLSLYVGSILHSRENLANSCGPYHYEFWPSISTTIGDNMPERQIWRVFFALGAILRVPGSLMFFDVLLQHGRLCHSSPPRLLARMLRFSVSSTTLTEIAGVCEVFCALGALLFTMVASIENCDYHNIFFVTYIVTNFLSHIIINHLVKINERNGQIYPSRAAACSSMWWKRLFFRFETLATLGVVVFFTRHKMTCASGSYSLATMNEWSFATSSLCYYATYAFELQYKGILFAGSTRAADPLSTSSLLVKNTTTTRPLSLNKSLRSCFPSTAAAAAGQAGEAILDEIDETTSSQTDEEAEHDSNRVVSWREGRHILPANTLAEQKMLRNMSRTDAPGRDRSLDLKNNNNNSHHHHHHDDDDDENNNDSRIDNSYVPYLHTALKDGMQIPETLSSSSTLPLFSGSGNGEEPPSRVRRLSLASAPFPLTMWMCDVYWLYMCFELIIALIKHMYYMPLVAMSMSYEMLSLLFFASPALLCIPCCRRWLTGELFCTRALLNLVALTEMDGLDAVEDSAAVVDHGEEAEKTTHGSWNTRLVHHGRSYAGHRRGSAVRREWPASVGPMRAADGGAETERQAGGGGTSIAVRAPPNYLLLYMVTCLSHMHILVTRYPERKVWCATVGPCALTLATFTRFLHPTLTRVYVLGDRISKRMTSGGGGGTDAPRLWLISPLKQRDENTSAAAAAAAAAGGDEEGWMHDLCHAHDCYSGYFGLSSSFASRIRYAIPISFVAMMLIRIGHLSQSAMLEKSVYNALIGIVLGLFFTLCLFREAMFDREGAATKDEDACMSHTCGMHLGNGRNNNNNHHVGDAARWHSHQSTSILLHSSSSSSSTSGGGVLNSSSNTNVGGLHGHSSHAPTLGDAVDTPLGTTGVLIAHEDNSTCSGTRQKGVPCGGADRRESNVVAALAYSRPSSAPMSLLGVVLGLYLSFCLTFYNCANYIPRQLALEPYPASLLVVTVFAAGVYYANDVLTMEPVAAMSTRHTDAVRWLLHHCFRQRWLNVGLVLLVGTLVMTLSSRETVMPYERVADNPAYPVQMNTTKEHVKLAYWGTREPRGSARLAFVGALVMTFCVGALGPVILEVTVAQVYYRRCRARMCARQEGAGAGTGSVGVWRWVMSRLATVLLRTGVRKTSISSSSSSGGVGGGLMTYAKHIRTRRLASTLCGLFHLPMELTWYITVIVVVLLYVLCTCYPFVPMADFVRERSRTVSTVHVVSLLLGGWLVTGRRRPRGNSSAPSSAAVSVDGRSRSLHVVSVLFFLGLTFFLCITRFFFMPRDNSVPVGTDTALKYPHQMMFLHRKIMQLRRMENGKTDSFMSGDSKHLLEHQVRAEFQVLRHESVMSSTSAIAQESKMNTLSMSEREAVWSAALAMSPLSCMIWTVHFGMDNYNVDSLQRMLEQIRYTDATVVGLLETETMRLTSGNRDMVEYLSYHLGFRYTDYGPTGFDNTFGCALITRYPIVSVRRYVLPSPLGELSCVIHAVLDVYGVHIHTYVGHFGNTQHWADGLLQSQFLGELVKKNPGPSVWLGYLVTYPGNKDKYHQYSDPRKPGLLRDTALELYVRRPWLRLQERGGFDELPPPPPKPDEKFEEFNIEQKISTAAHLEEIQVNQSFRRTPKNENQRHFYYNESNRYSHSHPRYEFLDRYCEYILYKTGLPEDEIAENIKSYKPVYTMDLFDWRRDIVAFMESLSDTEIQFVQFQFNLTNEFAALTTG